MAVLFQLVSTFDLPKDTYPLRQNEQTLKYYIIIDKTDYAIDLNNEFSVTDINGVNQECNINYQCQYCDQVCRYIVKHFEFFDTYIDQQDSEQNGTLQELVIEIENIQGNKQFEEFIALHSVNTNQIGFGMRRLCTDLIIQDRKLLELYFPIKYICIKCGFIVLFISWFYSQIKIEESKQRNNNIVDTYSFFYSNIISQITNLLDLYHIFNMRTWINKNINIENVNIQVDTLNPFTELPKDVFSEIANYYKQFGFSIVNQGYLSIHENKFRISDISAIKIYINETFYLEYQPYQFLYYQGEYIQLPFKQSKKKSLIIGVTFLHNVYLTINQNEKSFSFSQFDCQSSLVQSEQSGNNQLNSTK